jgi:hypothetical protein
MLRESEESAKHSADVSELESSSSEDETEKYDADNAEVDVNEKLQQADSETQDTVMEEAQSDTEDVKIANAKAYAAAMNRSVGGPNNAAALRAKKILES